MSAPAAAPAVLLVVPVHDEGARLAAFAADLAAQAPGGSAPPTRIVVVDDGSGPAAARLQAEAVEAAGRRLAAAGAHTMELRTAPANLGKGRAIRLGWDGAGRATWLGFVDGDGAVPAHEVWRLAGRLAGAPAFDVLAAARVRGAGRQVRRAPLRDLQGRVFARAAGAVLGLGLRDPQCGLKFFRAARLAPLLPSLREGRWLLDLELLVKLAQAGATIAEEPIDWHESGRSTVVAGVDPLRMALGLVRLRAGLGRAPRRSRG